MVLVVMVMMDVVVVVVIFMIAMTPRMVMMGCGGLCVMAGCASFDRLW